MSTPHNEAEKNSIAGKVLMPGDPLRAKYIAETFLTDAVCFNKVRNMFGYTGKYKGKPVSVMGGGMGMPSVGIYSYELFNEYNVDEIIRIGSAGGYQDDINLRDVVIALSASTDSRYAYQFNLPGYIAPTADYSLVERAVSCARSKNIPVHVGMVVSTDVFYNADESVNAKWRDMGALAIEMEACALYLNAAKAKKKALCILTVSDHFYKKEILSPKERQTGFNDMIDIALNM